MSDFEYKKIENGISIIKYTGEETVINIPDKIDGLPVIRSFLLPDLFKIHNNLSI